MQLNINFNSGTILNMLLIDVKNIELACRDIVAGAWNSADMLENCL